ncbi:MAG: twin-arginine translocation signal domain-containing protein, partial [Terriglobia bacterium]
MNEPSKPGAVTRRDFLKTGLQVTSAGLASLGTTSFLPRRVLGA